MANSNNKSLESWTMLPKYPPIADWTFFFNLSDWKINHFWFGNTILEPNIFICSILEPFNFKYSVT